jgi:hypothetical protein
MKKSLYIARQGEQKDWLQNFCFALSFAQTNPLLRDRALSLSLKKPWRVAQKWHSVSLRDTLAPAVSGKSENWRRREDSNLRRLTPHFLSKEAQ